MAKNDFNKSMDKYISGIRKSESVPNKPGRQLRMILNKINILNQQVPKNLPAYEVHVEEKSPGFLKRLFRGLTRKEKQELAEEIKEEPMELKEELEEIKEEYDELEHTEGEIEEIKEGLFKRFLSILKGEPRDVDINVEEVEELISRKIVYDKESEEVRADLKRISKILLEVYHELPQSKRDKFKDSPEFEEYKRILEKYNLVK